LSIGTGVIVTLVSGHWALFLILSLMTTPSDSNDFGIGIAATAVTGGIPLGLGIALFFLGRRLYHGPRATRLIRDQTRLDTPATDRTASVASRLLIWVGGLIAAAAMLATLVAVASIVIPYGAITGSEIAGAALYRYGWMTGIPFLIGIELFAAGYYLRRRQPAVI